MESTKESPPTPLIVIFHYELLLVAVVGANLQSPSLCCANGAGGEWSASERSPHNDPSRRPATLLPARDETYGGAQRASSIALLTIVLSWPSSSWPLREIA